MRCAIFLLVCLFATGPALAADPSPNDFAPVGISREAFATVSHIQQVNTRIDDLSDRVSKLQAAVEKLNATCGVTATTNKVAQEEQWKAEGWTKGADGYWYQYPKATPVQSYPMTISSPGMDCSSGTCMPSGYNSAPVFMSTPPMMMSQPSGRIFGGGGGFFRGGGCSGGG